MKTQIQSEKLTLAEISALSHDGRAIAHIHGKTTFLHGGLPNETVEFRYLRKHRQYDEGYVVNVLKPAEHRIAPKCPHFGVCGGCSVQHLTQDAQITFKQSVLLEQLNHIGHTVPDTILPPLIAEHWNYRRKARLGVKYVRSKNKVIVGFRELNGRYLANISSCIVLHPSVGEKIEALGQLIANLHAFQSIPQIEVAVDDQITALVFRHLEALSESDLQKLEQFAQQENFHIYLQPGGIGSVHRLWPKMAEQLLNYQIPAHNVSIYFRPTDFTQINYEINLKMIDRAIDLLEIEKEDRVLDLFCGLGNFTLPLARYCHSITGVEGDTQLVQRAQENAKINAIENANFYCTNLQSDFSHDAWAQQHYDKILLDPPRTGALDAVKQFNKLNAKAIVYISCNPATLARDSKEIIEQGFKLKQAGVMDMFPHTSHVESIAHFVRKRG